MAVRALPLRSKSENIAPFAFGFLIGALIAVWVAVFWLPPPAPATIRLTVRDASESHPVLANITARFVDRRGDYCGPFGEDGIMWAWVDATEFDIPPCAWFVELLVEAPGYLDWALNVGRPADGRVLSGPVELVVKP